jgi:hypothetical protein
MSPWNKGKTGIYSKKTLQKMRDAKKDYVPWNKGKPHSFETRKKISEARKGNPLSKQHVDSLKKSFSDRPHPMLGKKHSLDSKKKMSINSLMTISKIKRKYKLFSKIEEMRYNPNKPIEEREIQVHCKNHKCQNSKEQTGWFTPTKRQIYERIRCLEKNGSDNSYFYCCDECKIECPLYNLQSDPFKQTKHGYTQEEYNHFRKYVLERDNYKCQYCGKKAEHVHHERPQKLEPFFALDPDLAWSVCKECHYKYGHSGECSTGYLANVICL